MTSSPAYQLIQKIPPGSKRTALIWAYGVMRTTDDVIDRGFLLLPQSRRRRACVRMLASLQRLRCWVRDGGRETFIFPASVWQKSRSDEVGRRGIPPLDRCAHRHLSVMHPHFERFFESMIEDVLQKPLSSTFRWRRYAEGACVAPAWLLVWSLCVNDPLMNPIRSVAIACYRFHQWRDLNDDVMRGSTALRISMACLGRAARMARCSVGGAAGPHRRHRAFVQALSGHVFRLWLCDRRAAHVEIPALIAMLSSGFRVDMQGLLSAYRLS